jgi:hypothetical protein
MLFIEDTPIETVISMKAAIDAVEEALAEVAMGKAVVLPRRRIHHDNEMLFGLLPGSLTSRNRHYGSRRRVACLRSSRGFTASAETLTR